MTATKQKIIQTATLLYNAHGVASVRLQQIADSAELSIGNVAYHFKNKDAITLAVFHYLSNEAKEILKLFRKTPDLLDFDQQLKEWFYFQRHYAFYFTDNSPWPNQELLHPREQSFSRLVFQVQKRFDFHIKRGIVCANSSQPNYQAVAETIAMIITLWPSYRALQGRSVDNEREYKRDIWNQFVPYFTARGLTEYNELIQPLLAPSE
ncbi:TetR/AcrR family transcriptional regulator [Tunicatimonas pelagia]|uniref:TetR/AcrR family transcriptional regulator n=1 Tax=Tunicatimonas pelagia TaxID=931531 RepID=UPI002665CE3A|nr:TetR/AcrR family transcriptional regulator [Tunicatimonas pelagia]WKN41320.1 TetR/AcrR family transcriptional regulator [Tunicatimonas pelagia]